MRLASSKLLDILFPAKCDGCGNVGGYICDICLKKKVRFSEINQCHVCKSSCENLVHKKCRSKTSLDGVFVAAEYSKFIEKFISDIKYEFYHAMIEDLAKIMKRYIDNKKDVLHLLRSEKTVITSVPLSRIRKRWRGFNQSELLARELTKVFNSNYTELLIRKKFERPQVGLKRRERIANVKGAFEIQEDIALRNIGRIVLVDDVFTTGATLEECAKTLKRRCEVEVYGMVVARG